MLCKKEYSCIEKDLTNVSLLSQSEISWVESFSNFRLHYDSVDGLVIHARNYVMTCMYILQRTGRRFDSWLGQYSFRGLMMVMRKGSFLSHAVHPLFQHWQCGKAASGLERILCRVLVKKLLASKGMFTCCRNITEVLLKMILNTIQSINKSTTEMHKAPFYKSLYMA